MNKVYTEESFVARDLRGERVHKMIALQEGKGCEITTWECQGGILAKAVKYYHKEHIAE